MSRNLLIIPQPLLKSILLACQLVSSYSSVLIVTSLFWIKSTHCEVIRIAISCIYYLKPFDFSSQLYAIREAANLRTLRRITQPIEGQLQQTYFHVILLWLTFWMPLKFSQVMQYQFFAPLCGNVDYFIYPWEVLQSFWSMMLFC